MAGETPFNPAWGGLALVSAEHCRVPVLGLRVPPCMPLLLPSLGCFPLPGGSQAPALAQNGSLVAAFHWWRAKSSTVGWQGLASLSPVAQQGPASPSPVGWQGPASLPTPSLRHWPYWSHASRRGQKSPKGQCVLSARGIGQEGKEGRGREDAKPGRFTVSPRLRGPALGGEAGPVPVQVEANPTISPAFLGVAGHGPVLHGSHPGDGAELAPSWPWGHQTPQDLQDGLCPIWTHGVRPQH